MLLSAIGWEGSAKPGSLSARDATLLDTASLIGHEGSLKPAGCAAAAIAAFACKALLRFKIWY